MSEKCQPYAGDILVHGERGAQILTTPEMAAFLTSAMSSVGGEKFTLSPLVRKESLAV